MFHHPFVIDHYQDNDYEYIISELLSVPENDNNTIEENTCFICLEKNSPISLQNAYVIKNKKPRCRCKEMVHMECLEKWYDEHDNHNNCPMCNTIFNENNSVENGRNIPLIVVTTMQFTMYFIMTYCFFFLICLYLYFFHIFFTLHSKQYY
jgi:hypothetical protein